MELLKKWLDGSINWKEEKLLRKQAKKDSFLEDALTGLDTLPNADHSESIKILEQRLQERISKKKKRTSFPVRAIAAAAIFLLSVGIWWNIQDNFKPAPIAERQTKSVSPTASPLQEINTTESKEEVSIPNTVAAITDNIAEEKKTEEKKTLPKEFKTPQEKEPLNTYTEDVAITQKELPKTVLSNDLQEDVSTITNTQKPVEVVTEASNITMEVASSKVFSIEEEKEADGVVQMEEVIAANAAPTVMSEEPMDVTSTPTDMGVISAVAEREMPVAMKRRAIETPTTKVFPVGGMEDFLMYLKANKRYPETTSIKGTVFLVFSLEQDGTVKDVEITKSLHPDYDQEAIRLLKEGPKWISPASVAYCEISF